MGQSSKARFDKPVTWQLVAEVCVLIALLCSQRAQTPVPSPDDVAGLVVVDSASLMAETEQPLVQPIEAAGLKVAARIDHGAKPKNWINVSNCPVAFRRPKDWYTLDSIA